MTCTGETVEQIRWNDGAGGTAELLSYGATLRSVTVPDRNGQRVDVCLGYDTLAEYEAGNGYLGATVGRYANRIAGAALTLHGVRFALSQNDGVNHLHGGMRGFDRRVWQTETLADGVCFTLHSTDGDEGYPGALAVRAIYRFSRDHRLSLRYEAVSDADTVVNLTAHVYWNLAGQGAGTLGAQTLTLAARRYAETGAGRIPTGRLLSVTDTPFDFTRPVRVAERLGHPLLAPTGGYDHSFALDGEGMRRVAVLESPESGIRMRVFTTQPCLQLYTANELRTVGKGGASYRAHGALCLETQDFPDAPHHPAFPGTVLRAGERYCRETCWDFG